MNEQPTHLDLFSGIGGFAIAAGWAGYRTVAFCEQDNYCTKVLNRHWPDVPVIADIRDFDGSKWRGAGLLTGGFPCQPFSVAGERRGSSDDRALWPEMFRIIKEARPRWVLGENVAGIINMALDDVLSQLEGEGYTTGAVVLPACSLNAPHRRDRVWIVAHAKHKERQETRPSGGREKEKRNPSADAFTGCSGAEDVAHASGKRLQGCAEAGDNGEDWPELGDKQFARFSGVEGWNKFPTVAAVCRRNDGIPNRTHRLKALGNAIVPQVAYEILKLTNDKNP